LEGKIRAEKQRLENPSRQSGKKACPAGCGLHWRENNFARDFRHHLDTAPSCRRWVEKHGTPIQRRSLPKMK
jgi:hypothetical protein